MTKANWQTSFAIYIGKDRQQDYYGALSAQGGPQSDQWAATPKFLQNLWKQGWRMRDPGGVTELICHARSETALVAELKGRLAEMAGPGLKTVSGGLYAARQTPDIATAVQALEWHDNGMCLVCGSDQHTSSATQHLQRRLPSAQEREAKVQEHQAKVREKEKQAEKAEKEKKAAEEALKKAQAAQKAAEEAQKKAVTELQAARTKIEELQAELQAARSMLAASPGLQAAAHAVQAVVASAPAPAPPPPAPAPPPPPPAPPAAPEAPAALPPPNEWESDHTLPSLERATIAALLRDTVNHKESPDQAYVPLLEVALRLGAAEAKRKEAKKRIPADPDSEEYREETEDEFQSRTAENKRGRAKTWCAKYWPKHVELAQACGLDPEEVALVQYKIERNRSAHVRLSAVLQMYGR